MSENKSVSEMLLEIFGGNPYHAVGEKTPNGVAYSFRDGPITEELIEKHLAGEIVIASYPVDHQTNMVKWLGFDVDSPGDLEAARNICNTILSRLRDIPRIVEFSGNKGYHIIIYNSQILS